MTTIKIGGVPEHFNLPWHLSIEDGSFEEVGIDLQWMEFPGGTGAMCAALREKEIDLAIVLTEGIVKDIADGNPSKIVQTYVQSPLVWGVHVGAESDYHQPKDINGGTAAISRYGSGSHLMSYVHAENMGWDTSGLKFHLVKNLNGAVKELTNGNADYFLWEHFTTKPLVDEGTFRRIDDRQTPWPCFVIAVRDEILDQNLKEIDTILNVINTTTLDFKNIPSIDKTISNEYQQKLEDIREWLSITEWGQSQLSGQELEKVQEQLLRLELISHKLAQESILFDV